MPTARALRQPLALLLLSALLAGLASCGYSTRPGRLRAGLETVAVPYFENRSDEPAVQIELTDQVVQGLIADRTLKVVEEGAAQALVLGTVREFRYVEAFFGSDRQADEYQIQATVEVTVVDRASGDTLAGPRAVRGNASYLLSEGSAGEAAARRDVAEEIVQGILNLVIEEW